MRKFLTTAFAATVAVAALPALAAEKTCSCIISEPAAPAAGKIVASRGSVFLSGEKGLVPAEPGMELTTGAYLTVGINAAATITAGTTCSLDIAENHSVSLLPQDGNRICLQVSDLQSGDQPVTVSELGSKSVVNAQTFGSGRNFLEGPIPLIIIGGIGITAIATNDGPRPASD